MNTGSGQIHVEGGVCRRIRVRDTGALTTVEEGGAPMPVGAKRKGKVWD